MVPWQTRRSRTEMASPLRRLSEFVSSIGDTHYRGSLRSSWYSMLAKSEPDCWITLFGSGGNLAAAIAPRAVSSAHRLWVVETTFTLWGWPCLSSWNVHFID